MNGVEERGRRAPRAGLSLGALVACAAPLAAFQEEPAKDPPVSGLLLTRYRARFTSDESDQDLYETLDLSFHAPDRSWSGALLARGAWDLDGRSDSTSDFFGLLDTYDHRFRDAALPRLPRPLANDSCPSCASAASRSTTRR